MKVLEDYIVVTSESRLHISKTILSLANEGYDLCGDLFMDGCYYNQVMIKYTPTVTIPKDYGIDTHTGRYCI